MDGLGIKESIIKVHFIGGGGGGSGGGDHSHKIYNVSVDKYQQMNSP